jgi:hypothetical protein
MSVPEARIPPKDEEVGFDSPMTYCFGQ